MAFLKIIDIRAGRRADGSANAIIHVLNQNIPVTTAAADPARVGLMIAVFASGRDCYWDDQAHVFQTSAEAFVTTPSPLPKGRVESWEIRIVDAGGQQPELFLRLISDAQTQKSSGGVASGWAYLQAPEREIPLILGLLRGKYCYYSQTGLRNTEFVADIGWAGLP